MAATGNSGTKVWNLETGRIDYADPEFRRGAGLLPDGCGLVSRPTAGSRHTTVELRREAGH
jgi:hypothetical protein